MKNKMERIEHYGHLDKVERLRTLDAQVLPGTLVLEAPEPFPGSLSYYGETPHLATPLYVYLAIEGNVDLERCARAIEIVRDSYEWEFSGAYVTMKIQHETLHCIRIRRLLNFEQIPSLQEEFRNAGLTLKKMIKPLNGDAMLTFHKLFQLFRLGDGMYLDVDEKDHGYFEVPNQFSNAAFTELISRVKNNSDLQSYDFARAFFYTKDRIIDVIRVYSPEMDEDVVQKVRDQVMLRL